MSFWDEAMRLESQLEEKSYFELLDIEPEAIEADPTALTTAYHQALRRYHPDRYAIGSSAEQKQALARICARIGEAYRGLSSPAKRAAYLEQLASGETRPRKKRQTIVETRDPKSEKARVLLASAEALAAEGNDAAARAKLDLALQFEPDSKALAAARERMEPR